MAALCDTRRSGFLRGMLAGTCSGYDYVSFEDDAAQPRTYTQQHCQNQNSLVELLQSFPSVGSRKKLTC
jgi:hypothetical protein